MKSLVSIRKIDNSVRGLATLRMFSEMALLPGHTSPQYFENESYHVFAGFVNDKPAGYGEVIINGTTGWLGNIYVLEEFREKGIGRTITSFLINYLKKNNCHTLLTIATENTMGNYQKLGFLTSSIYCKLRGQSLEPAPLDKNIRLFETRDMSQVFSLDMKASHEDRKKLFPGNFSNGYVYFDSEKEKVIGYYLPGVGEGPVIASEANAGLELLRLKHTMEDGKAIIPCDNKLAVDFLKKNHYVETEMLYRMSLGEDLDWAPEMIFGRFSAYAA